MSEPAPRYYTERELLETVAKVAQGVHTATLARAKQQAQSAAAESLRAGVESALAGLNQRGPRRVGHASASDDESLTAAALACLRDTSHARGRQVRRVTVTLSAAPSAEPARVEYLVERPE